ncbi:MAG: glucose 1-dehydrogenase [Rhodospirillaceae bacterium]|nr:glucose 1-dehydrogenase [Rhodospirillaceae bacterium]
MTVTLDLAGKVALVTGASGGLGSGFARALAASGARVALAARRLDKLRDVEKTIAGEGGVAASVELDVTDKASVEAGLAAAEAALGTVDVLVNNSGIVARKPIFEHTEEDWDRVLDTNLKGAWMLSWAFAKRLVEAGRPGSIVNISSVLGYGRVSSQVHEYCASKAGLIQLTKSMATELARHRIRVNALAPGYIVTDLNRGFLSSEAGDGLRNRIPQRRFGETADLVPALLLLASDSGSYMTGSVIEVDGGLSVASV